MWSIEVVKRNGWSNLKNYYWPAFVVSLITALIFNGASVNRNTDSGNTNYVFRVGNVSRSVDVSSDSDLAAFLLSSIFFSILAAVFLILLIAKILIGNPLIVGGCRFYMESRAQKRSAGISRLLWVFSSGSYWNVVKVMFMKDLYTVLWFLLFVIPGIVKMFEYMQIPYILSENPDADSRDVFALTKEMMSGYKFQYFLLALSFIGWILLAAFAGAIAGSLASLIVNLFVAPYMDASYAEVYASSRSNIAGFPFKGYGGEEDQSVYEQMNGNDYYTGY